MKNKWHNVIVKFIKESENIIAACTCPAGSSVKCLGKCNHPGATLFVLEVFNRKNLKTSVEPLRCTTQFSKWNVPHDFSTNLVYIEKTLVKKIKFGEPKNNCHDPGIPNDKYLDNDSMNPLKRELQKYLPSSGFFIKRH